MRQPQRPPGRALSALLLAIAAPCLLAGQQSNDINQQVAELRALVKKLQARVDELEARLPAPPAPASTALVPPAAPAPQPDSALLAGTTVNFLLDGYYGYNFNSPIGRVNRLRAFDVSSNSFSLSQAGVVLENATDLDSGKRWGARLDLQWGQATQTMQGNPANEPRPEIYRAIFQAYGTYVFALGKGLTVDFGKWASALGIEGAYTKDQMNYSRSYWFNALPFYHMGARVNYKFNDRVSVNYWLTNGAQQTEDFNGFKDQLAGVVLQPRKDVSWTVNYYLGQENPDVVYLLNGVPPGLTPPTQQGVPFLPIASPPTGRMHIFDSYATWSPTPALTFALEGDYLIHRVYSNSSPLHMNGGAVYAQYRFTPKLALAARAEYLSDVGGMFSGTSQALKETTLTTSYKVADGLLMRGEWRHDFSNQPYFYTSTLGILKRSQTTATLGMTWWFGGKQGSW